MILSYHIKWKKNCNKYKLVKVFLIHKVSFCKSRISTYGDSELCIHSLGRLARVIGIEKIKREKYRVNIGKGRREVKKLD